MSCSLSIVECLRKKGIYPTATAKAHFSLSYPPSNALDYETRNSYATKDDGTAQWISFDFKTIVSLKSYQIKAGGSRWINGWNLSACNDGSSWKPVSSHNGFPGDTLYNLSSTQKIRYVKIDGQSSHSNPNYFQIYHVKFFGPQTPKNVYTYTFDSSINMIIIRIITLLCVKY